MHKRVFVIQNGTLIGNPLSFNWDTMSITLNKMSNFHKQLFQKNTIASCIDIQIYWSSFFIGTNVSAQATSMNWVILLNVWLIASIVLIFFKFHLHTNITKESVMTLSTLLRIMKIKINNINECKLKSDIP